MRSRALCLPSLALALLTSAGVAAAPPALRDAVHVEQGRCVSAGALVAAVAAWRGKDTLSPGLSVTVKEGPGLRARFVVRRGGAVLGEREIDAGSASCRELGDALALLVAVALDAAEASPGPTPPAASAPVAGASVPVAGTSAPVAGASAPVAGASAPVAGTSAPVAGASAPVADTPPGTEPPSAPADGGPDAAASARLNTRSTSRPAAASPALSAAARPLTMPRGFGAPAPAPAPRLAVEVSAGGGAGFDLVPARVAIVNAAVGLRVGPARGLAGLVRAGILATSTGLFPLGEGQVEARLAAGRLDACALWMPARAGLEACAGVGAGWLWARGNGFDADAEAGAPWAGAAARLAGRLHVVGPLSLLGGVDAVVPVLAPHVQVQDRSLRTVAEVPVPPVGVGLFLGVAFTFP